MIDDIALTLHDISAVRFGEFKLHSGQISPIYIDLRVLVSHPQALAQVAKAYAAKISQLNHNILGAYPYAGLPIGVAVSLEMGIPLVYPRKEVKKYGTGKRVEGVWTAGQTAVLVEDLITSGKSIVEAIRLLKEADINASEAVVLIDREQGGTAALSMDGITVHSVLTLTALLDALVRHGRISTAKRHEILDTLGISQ